VRIKATTQRSLAGASIVRVSDLELERPRQQVRRAGRSIELTSKEYALLEFLMSHAGRVVSREMIIQHVWDKSFEGVADVVDVYISQLRKKVDTGYEAKLVHDVRGLGYMICEANPHEVWQASG
jgi:DNA-binding response OmpR family regulator